MKNGNWYYTNTQSKKATYATAWDKSEQHTSENSLSIDLVSQIVYQSVDDMMNS